MRLVMVHGRAQGGLDPQTLRKNWLGALGEGLAAARRELPEGAQMEFPFYGDELQRLADERRMPAPADADELAFQVELLTEIAEGAGVSKTELARELAREEKGIQNWRWVQAILRALDGIPGVNSRFIEFFTRDVYVYLTRTTVRQRINEIVAAAIGEQPCVVLAHSLGTIVAYDTLRSRMGGARCPRLVTVGSPLGIKAIKGKLAQPLTHPPCVEHWFNAMDSRDIVALYPLDAANFDVCPPVENKTDVHNSTENRHGISGYLTDAVVAAKVVEFL